MYLKHFSRRKKTFWPVLGLIGAAGLIYFFGSLILWPLAGPVDLVVRPAWWVGQGVSASTQSLVDFFRDRNHLAIENRRLLEDNARLRVKLLANLQVSEENNYLRELFGRFEADRRPLVAEVIFLPNFIPNQILTIDLGHNNLVRPLRVGDWAISAGTVIVGQVASVGTWSSKIELLSTTEGLPVMIGADRLVGVAVGAGAGNFTIILPRDMEIKVGDRVLASTFDSLLLGIVRHIERDENSPNQTVLVKTPINLWQLKWLEIYEPKA